MNSGNNRTAITSRFKHESWHRSNFFAFPAKLLLMKRWWNESLRSVLVNYCKLFLMSWEWRFWLDSDWLLSTAESEWRLIAPVLRVPFWRKFVRCCCCNSASRHTSKRTPQSYPACRSLRAQAVPERELCADSKQVPVTALNEDLAFYFINPFFFVCQSSTKDCIWWFHY